MINVDFGVDGISELCFRLKNNPIYRHINVGIIITDTVMKNIVADKLSGKRTPEVNRLFEFARTVWEGGNPGLIFSNRVNMDHPFDGEYLSTCNSCAEQYLLPNEGCPLGSINLGPLVENYCFNWEKFELLIRHGVRFLNDVIRIL